MSSDYTELTSSKLNKMNLKMFCKKTKTIIVWNKLIESQDQVETMTEIDNIGFLRRTLYSFRNNIACDTTQH